MRDLGRRLDPDGAARRPVRPRRAASISPGSSARSANTGGCSARCWSPSFFLQLFALVSPLFFQVVIDKVLVHRSMSTLDVLVIGLVAIALFETLLGDPAHLPVLAHHQPDRCRARRAAVPPSAGAADRLFPGAPRRRFRGAGARAREHPQFPHQLGADAGHRSVLHLRVPGGHVRLLAAADLHRAGVVPVLHRDFGRGDAAVPPAGWTRNSAAAPRTRPSWSKASPASRR